MVMATIGCRQSIRIATNPARSNGRGASQGEEFVSWKDAVSLLIQRRGSYLEM